jgi:hypothetical protein
VQPHENVKRKDGNGGARLEVFRNSDQNSSAICAWFGFFRERVALKGGLAVGTAYLDFEW